MAISNQRHSLIVWQSYPGGPGDTPLTVLSPVIDRLRAVNRTDGAREISIAITKLEEAVMWLQRLEQRKEGQHGQADT